MERRGYMVEYSIIVPVRNEGKFIREFLLNIDKQTLDKSKFEVILIDGMSIDNTKSEISKINDHLSFELIMMNNPKKIIPSALNIGFRNARGEIIIRLDVHSKINEFYLEQLIKEFKLHADCCNIGGRTLATGYNDTSNQIAFALNTPFGVGGAKFRYSYEIADVDTVFPGIFNKADLVSIGGWNESWIINEDAELNYRLKNYTEQLIKVIPNEKIQIEYYPRNTLKGLAKQYFKYGLWRNKTNVSHPNSMRISHLIPPMLLSTILLTILLSFINFYILLLLLIILSTYLLIIKNIIGKDNRKDLSYFKLLIVFLVLHFSWGAGTLIGYVKFGVPFRGIFKTLVSDFKKRSFVKVS